MKLNSDEQTLAESKILLLYILDKVGKPISHNAFLELVSSISDMNYFYFQQFLLDLLEDKFIEQYEKDESTLYEITRSGKETLALTIDIIPGILKLKVDSQFKESLDYIKDKFSISAEYFPITEKEFMVRCKIIENNSVVFDLQAHAGSREQAKKIVDNWNQKSPEIYPQILDLLVK